jgi:hypothetical protein
MAVAVVNKILRSRCMQPDGSLLAAIGLVAQQRVSLPCKRPGNIMLSATLVDVATTAWISFVRLSTPKCAFIPKYQWLPFFV